jgi:formylglycine-generating enzyme required for sulfatase activity
MPPYFEIPDSSRSQKIVPGRLFRLVLEATDSETDSLPFRILAGPAGMTLSGRELQWMPLETDRGNHHIEIMTFDRGGLKDTAALDLNVNRLPVFLQKQAKLKASPGRRLTFALKVEDQDGDSLALSLLTPRAGMQINGSSFQWTPQAPDTGNLSVLLGADDGRDGMDTMLIDINVDRPPDFRNVFSGIDTVGIGATSARTFEAVDADGDALAYRLLQPPPGASLSGRRAEVAAGDCNEGWTRVTVVADDGRGGLDTTAWQLLIMRGREDLNGAWQPASLADIRHRAGMVLIEAKARHFGMGKRCPDSLRTWKVPMHRVDFTYDFWMDTTEATAGEYYGTLGLPIPDRYGDSGAAADDISWFEAVLFANARSKREGLDTVYEYAKANTALYSKVTLDSVRIHMDRNGYRLPTSAEWEYAARGGTFQPNYWGYDTALAVTGKYEWTSLQSPALSRVAEKRPNPYGLYDMAGNVWEWSNDYFSLLVDSADRADPIGPVAVGKYDDPLRIIRGGNRYSTPEYLALYRLGNLDARKSSSYGGFRLVRVDAAPASFMGAVIR